MVESGSTGPTEPGAGSSERLLADAEPAVTASSTSRRPADAARGDAGRREFGWREGLLLGTIVLVVVYAIAELTAWLPALRDGLEHLPVTIAVLVVGTLVVLAAVGRGTRRR